MKRFSKQETLAEINNGNEDVLVYLSRKYFPVVRRLLRIRGFRDDQTPEIFSKVLASTYVDLQRHRSGHTDFETYFLNAVNEEVRIRNGSRQNIGLPGEANLQPGIVAQCVSIMDDQAQKLLYARVAEKLSYERIAEKFQFSNSVIAQYEVNKALNQLEAIVKVRMNISQN